MSVWDSEPDWVAATPERQEIALSAVHKAMLLVGIVAMILALWAVTTPATPTQYADPTLGPPLTKQQANLKPPQP